jgi:anti-sigma regulatory factor (Ser/Thr protein kinase)
MLLHSDGVAEAHSAEKEMFGFPRLLDVVGSRQDKGDVIDRVLTELDRFTPQGGEQEDDITLVALTRADGGSHVTPTGSLDVSFTIPSEQGNERAASERVAEAVASLGLESARLERLKTAVSEAVMNAIEHGNQSNPELPVEIGIRREAGELLVRITDEGGEREIAEAETPDLEAKIEGLQKPRGWGLFLIKNMVDDLRVTTDGIHHTVELVMRLEGGDDGGD